MRYRNIIRKEDLPGKKKRPYHNWVDVKMTAEQEKKTFSEAFDKLYAEKYPSVNNFALETTNWMVVFAYLKFMNPEPYQVYIKD